MPKWNDNVEETNMFWFYIEHIHSNLTCTVYAFIHGAHETREGGIANETKPKLIEKLNKFLICD